MKRILHFCYLLILLIASSPLFANNDVGSIRGNAINKSSGNPIANARVSLIQGKKIIATVTTNVDGTFILPQVFSGVYDLSCSFPGFVNQKIVGLEIRENHTKLAFFKLSYGDTKVSGEDVVMTYASLQTLREHSKAEAGTADIAIADIPATIFVFSQEEIAERGYMHIAELLQDVPQLEINDRASSTDYNIVSSRGITGNEKLLILINGVRMTSMTLASHSLDKGYFIRHAERVEVILGPSSSTYEADAFVGVVNIIMPDGRKKLGAALSSSYGMYNTNENAIIGVFGKGRVGGTISLGCYNTQDANLARHYSKDYEWFNNTYQQSGAVMNSILVNDTTQLSIQPYGTPQLAYSIQTNINFFDFEIGMLHNVHKYSAATGVDPRFTTIASDNRTGMQNSNVYAKHLFKSKKNKKFINWSLESLFNWNNYRISDTEITQNVYTGYNKAYRAGYDNNIRLRETFNIRIKPNEIHQHELLAGAYCRYSSVVPKTNYTLIPFDKDYTTAEQDIYYIGSNVTDSDGNSMKLIQNVYYSTQLNVGGFVQYRFKYKDLFSFSLGSKIDFVRSRTNGAVYPLSSYLNITPRAAFVIKPQKNLRIKLFYAEAALAPPMNRQYEHFGIFNQINQGSNTVLQGEYWRIPSDTLLAPEQVRSTELDLSYSKGNLLVIANGYFSYGQNLIRDVQSFEVPVNVKRGIFLYSATQPINDAEAFLYGASIYASYKFDKGREDQFSFKADLSYAFADGRTIVEHIPFTAQHTIKAGFVAKYKFISLSARLLFRSASYNEGFQAQDGTFYQTGNNAFATLNLFLKGTVYENKKSGLGIDLFVKANNVTNARYYHVTNSDAISMGRAPQAPILVLGGLNFRFIR